MYYIFHVVCDLHYDNDFQYYTQFEGVSIITPLMMADDIIKVI